MNSYLPCLNHALDVRSVLVVFLVNSVIFGVMVHLKFCGVSTFAQTRTFGCFQSCLERGEDKRRMTWNKTKNTFAS